jgi:hypothetical protein
VVSINRKRNLPKKIMTEKSPNPNIDVASVIQHLNNLKDQIGNITLHIEWKNGTQGVYGNPKTVDGYATASMMIQQYALQSLRDEGLIDEDIVIKPTVH